MTSLAPRNSVLNPRVVLMLCILCFCAKPCQQLTACQDEKQNKRFYTCGSSPQAIPAKVISPYVASDWDSSLTPYAVSQDPLQFTVLPSGGQHRLDSPVTLACSINCDNCYPPVLVYWTINGTKISELIDSDEFLVDSVSHSLSVSSFGSSKEGSYACHVEDGSNGGKYTISSYPVELRLARFTSWSNEVYDSPDTIILEGSNRFIRPMTVSPFDAAILQCTVTGDQPPSPVYWSGVDQTQWIKLPNGNILVDHWDQTSFVCINEVEGPNSRYLTYDVSVQMDDQGAPVMVASPRSQVVAEGANVTLYCLAHSNTSVDYQWYNNGLPIDSTIAPQVMFIEDIRQSGSYECTCSNQYGNVSVTAEVTVIKRPVPVVSVASSSVGYSMSNGGIDVVLTDSSSGEDASNISIVLNCSPGSSAVTTGEADVPRDHLVFEWMVNGQYVAVNSSSHHQLRVSGSSISEVIGSVQCLVTSTGLSTSLTGIGYLRIVKDKSNPPSGFNISIPVEGEPAFDLHWSAQPGYMYQVEVYVEKDLYQEKDNILYQGNTSENCITVNMKVEAYLSMVQFRDNVRVRAISSSGQMSDYKYVLNIPSIDSKSLPQPFNLNNRKADHFVVINGKYNVTLDYDSLSKSYPDEFNKCDDDILNEEIRTRHCCAYKEDAEETCHTLNTDKYLKPNHKEVILVDCHSICHWEVGFDRYWSDTETFATDDLKPSVGGSITGMRSVDNLGTKFSVSLQIPPMNISCGVTAITLTCGRTNVTYHSMDFVFQLSDNDYCWDDCDLFFTYSNSKGISPRSNRYPLPRPSIDNISGFQKLSYGIVNDGEKAQVNWTIPGDMECLLRKHFITQITFFITDGKEAVNNCSSSIAHWKYNYTLLSNDVTSFTLPLDNQTTLVGDVCVKSLFIMDRSEKSFSVVLRGPTAHSDSSTDPNQLPPTSSSSEQQISTQYFLEIMLPTIASFIFVAIMIIVVVMCLFIRNKKQNRRIRSVEEEVNHLLAPDGSDKEMIDDEANSIVTKCESLITAKDQRMQSYLKDVEEFDRSNLDMIDEETAGDQVLVVKAEINPIVELETDDNGKKRKKKKRRQILGQDMDSPRKDEAMNIPEISLLKRMDCETVQNASQSVFRLIEETHQGHAEYYSHPPAITDLNKPLTTSNGASSDYETHELKELHKDEEDQDSQHEYEDCSTALDKSAEKPTVFIGSDCRLVSSSMMTSEPRQFLSSPLGPAASSLDPAASPLDPVAKTFSMGHNLGTSVKPVQQLPIVNSSHLPMEHFKPQGHMIQNPFPTHFSPQGHLPNTHQVPYSLQSFVSPHGTEQRVGNYSLATPLNISLPGSRNQAHITSRKLQNTQTIHPLDTTGHYSIPPSAVNSPVVSSAMNVPHPLAHQQLRRPSSVSTTIVASLQNEQFNIRPITTSTRFTNHHTHMSTGHMTPNCVTTNCLTSQPSTITVNNTAALVPAADGYIQELPHPLTRPSSRMSSSGISSPKSSGSFESVFAESLSGNNSSSISAQPPTPDSLVGSVGHQSDSTSGIGSPLTVYSPQVELQNIFSYPPIFPPATDQPSFCSSRSSLSYLPNCSSSIGNEAGRHQQLRLSISSNSNLPASLNHRRVSCDSSSSISSHRHHHYSPSKSNTNGQSSLRTKDSRGKQLDRRLSYDSSTPYMQYCSSHAYNTSTCSGTIHSTQHNTSVANHDTTTISLQSYKLNSTPNSAVPSPQQYSSIPNHTSTATPNSTIPSMQQYSSAITTLSSLSYYSTIPSSSSTRMAKAAGGIKPVMTTCNTSTDYTTTCSTTSLTGSKVPTVSTRPTSPTRPGYVLPSLLSHSKPSPANPVTMTTHQDSDYIQDPLPPSISMEECSETVVKECSDTAIGDLQIADSDEASSHDSYVESYSIDSATSSMEDFRESLQVNNSLDVQPNDYLIDDS